MVVSTWSLMTALTTSFSSSFTCIPRSVMHQCRPQVSSPKLVVMKPSEAAIATCMAPCRAKLDLIENGLRQALSRTMNKAKMFAVRGSISSVRFTPSLPQGIFCGNGDFKFEMTACFLRHSSSDITDMICYSFCLASNLNLIVDPAHDEGLTG